MTPRKTLYLVRGLPGSGKSSLARLIAPDANVAADDFFEQDGDYDFDFTKLKEAHEWCQEQTRSWMKEDMENIAVHNTFSRPWESSAYFELADDFGYTVFVVETQNAFGNTHGVPDEVVEQMRDRWEPLIGPRMTLRRQLRYRIQQAWFQLRRNLPWRR